MFTGGSLRANPRGCDRLLQRGVAGQGAEWTVGLRTKSQFIPNQARKSVPILGSPGTTARLRSAFAPS